jgi:hypothetical protein
LSHLVETYSGHRLHERPARFYWQGAWQTVVQVLSRWQEPGALCFTVLAADEQIYSLQYTQANDIWKVDLLTPGKPLPS